MAVWSVIAISKLEGPKRIDPEYYQPAFLDAYDKLKNCGFPCHRLGDLCACITDGSHVTPEYQNSGVRFLMVRDVQEEDINFNDNNFIGADFDKRLRHCKPTPGDIVLTKVGSVGTAAIVPNDAPDFNIFVSLAVLKRIEGVNKSYLSAFLNSRYGRMQACRRAKGISQPDLHLQEIREFLIPVPKNSFQEIIGDLLNESHRLKVNSRILYQQAEQMVLHEVGFDKVDLSWSPGYIVSDKDTRELSRIDAEHFQPKYVRLLRHLDKTGKAVKLGDILRSRIEKGVTPEYTDGGVAAVNSQHLGRYMLNFERVDHTPESYWAANRRAQIKHLDVLVYATGAYVGRTNCYLEKQKALAGVDILMVRPNQECDPIYLSAFLNSPLGMLQAEQWASGSAQRHLYPEAVANFTLYLPTSTFQQKIADLVKRSYETRAKAKKLLNEAVLKVETLLST